MILDGLVVAQIPLFNYLKKKKRRCQTNIFLINENECSHILSFLIISKRNSYVFNETV